MAASVTNKRIDAQDRLIVALDLETLAEAKSMVESLDGLVYTFKIGLTLQLAEGAEGFIRWLIKNDQLRFMDQCAGNTQPLFHSLRKCFHFAACSFRDTNPFQLLH